MGDRGTHKQGDQGGKSYPLAQGKPRNISQWLFHHNAVKEEGPVTNCRKNFPMKVVERVGDYRLYLVCNKVTLSPDRGGVLAQTWEITKAEAYHWDHRVKSQSREGKSLLCSSSPTPISKECHGETWPKRRLLANPSGLGDFLLMLLSRMGTGTWESHALVIANCKIRMCYSMLEISQQLLFASVMRPHYTLLDGALPSSELWFPVWFASKTRNCLCSYPGLKALVTQIFSWGTDVRSDFPSSPWRLREAPGREMALCQWSPSQSHLVKETDEVQSSYVDWWRRGRWVGLLNWKVGGQV